MKTSFIIAVAHKVTKIFKKQFQQNSNTLDATIDLEGREALIKQIDDSIAYEHQSFHNKLEALKREKEEIKNLERDWDLLQVSCYRDLSKSGKLLDRYIKKGKIKELKEF